MTWPIRQSTNNQVLEFGPFLSTSDGVTIVTSAISANDIQIFKHNATGLSTKNSGAATYVGQGYFQATFNSSDSNTVGRIKVIYNITSNACLPVWTDGVVYSSNVYDGLFGSTASMLPVDAVRIAGASSAANNMSSSALSTIGGSITSSVSLPTVSTGAVIMDFAMAADGQLQNRQVIFDANTATAGLREQAAQVSTWTNATSSWILSPPLSVTPAHGDTFRIF